MHLIRSVLVRIQLLLVFFLVLPEPSNSYAISHADLRLGQSFDKRAVESNRNQVRAEIEAGGWVIVWGDVINEADVATLIISIPTGSVAVWVQQQVQDQLKKFSQSLDSVADDVILQATDFLQRLLQTRKAGTTEIKGLGVKGGIATYKRKEKNRVFKTKLPNWQQPYIGLRIVKPLPTKVQPSPTKVQPSPTKIQPLPTSIEPLPTTAQPLPTEDPPLSTDDEPLPPDDEPLSPEDEPLPTGKA